jgi:catechol 2,3-dioxygenase-like lactoylglutathione lyase family enzyme
MPAKRSSKSHSESALEFNHAMIYSRDVAASLAFYGDQLGFRLIEQMDYRNTTVYARLKAPKGSSTIAIHALQPGESLPDAGGVRLYFEVRALEKFCASLQQKGVRFSKAPKMMPWGWKHAYLDDPDGHEISLYWAGAKRLKKSKVAFA